MNILLKFMRLIKVAKEDQYTKLVEFPCLRMCQNLCSNKINKLMQANQ